MRRRVSALLVLSFVALAVACGGSAPPTTQSVAQPAPPNPVPQPQPQPPPRDTPDDGKPSPNEAEAPPLVLSAKQLAQELHDGGDEAFGRLFRQPLQVEGVVHEIQTVERYGVSGLIFKEKVTGKKAAKPQEFTIYMNFKEPFPDGKPPPEAAVGKTVAVRGNLTGGGVGGLLTLNECVLVKGGKQRPGP